MSEAEIASLLWWGLSGLFILVPLLFCGPLLDRPDAAATRAAPRWLH
jgi:hypothetical protein